MVRVGGRKGWIDPWNWILFRSQLFSGYRWSSSLAYLPHPMIHCRQRTPIGDQLMLNIIMSRAALYAICTDLDLPDDLPDGIFSVPLPAETYERISAASLPGEDFSDTVIRIYAA
jgi:hypothetical protein